MTAQEARQLTEAYKPKLRPTPLELAKMHVQMNASAGWNHVSYWPDHELEPEVKDYFETNGFVITKTEESLRVSW